MRKPLQRGPRPMPLEELAVNLLFKALGEHRYNRSPQEYADLISLIPPLKKAIYLVNQGLQEIIEGGQQHEICYFQPGDLAPRYIPFPSKISIDTLRKGLITAGFREPKRQKARS